MSKPNSRRQLRKLSEHMVDPQCPECGQLARRSATRYGIRHDCCGLSSWDYKPLQTQSTLNARNKAHSAFDPLWKNKTFPTRNKAYQWLSEATGIPLKECHMSLMTKEQAELVSKVCAEFKEGVLL